MKILRGGFASRHDPSFILSRPYGQANHVILLLRSKAEYWINGQHYLLKQPEQPVEQLEAKSRKLVDGIFDSQSACKKC